MNTGSYLCIGSRYFEHILLNVLWLTCLQEWKINHFQVTTLKQLGATYQLGHTPGKPCLFPRNAQADFTVIHTNGIHNVAARFCGCQGSSRTNVVQLLQACWFPSTPSDPQACTTFSCLRLFHHLNCLAKIPAYDFYHGLEIMSTSRQRIKPKV
ncbi:hypothetical protein BT96DRAFT_826041 [Gymnopus androsaceus JB14]|uniref:CxC2-like cysteine cluster KDZ transposase-associated domain-containing protein n=1 Tax=Gymnopus androsaceus JB14 TaxID=1447944 RepID=A0A6A4HCT4_9AGAR|nr:hypothetical protein BT96DRAFT_826041 [Gymnopus androsaceus JB14]